MLDTSISLDEMRWQVKPRDDAKFHFKICEPRINPDIDFQEDLDYNLNRISRLIALDDYRIEIEGNARIAKVRLRLSPAAIQQNTSLEVAIKRMCKAMITTGDAGKRVHVECLTKRSIWGVIPISRIFETYWTASFFNNILSEGPRELANLAEDFMRESRPYIVPTFMVFGFAALAGLHDCFHLMQHVYGLNLNVGFDLPAFLRKTFPTVGLVFTWLAQKASSGQALGGLKPQCKVCLETFTSRYDDVLECFSDVNAETAQTIFRDPQWMFSVCSNLCKMSVAASNVILLRKDLLDAIMSAATLEQINTVKSGIASLGSVCVAVEGMAAFSTAGGAAAATGGAAATGATSATAAAGTAAGVGAGVGAGAVLVPLAASAAAICFAVWAFESHVKGKKLQDEYAQYKLVFGITKTSWTSAFAIRLTLEWFRLHEGEDPSVLEFPDPQFQLRWQAFVRSYRETARRQNVQGNSEVQLLSNWLVTEVGSLRLQRVALENIMNNLQ